ncbi:hypothetical protein PanWU01x14_013740 [Parasponia andersonii]|uniref:Uncharacterized protein n=1 Tax=Parasponia andersonii TaxID=3476 RepID=A0A2P5E152_PARAD|nr:hypothetical protein PanWU01x14_013740 [Parasponia andersonii]
MASSIAQISVLGAPVDWSGKPDLRNPKDGPLGLETRKCDIDIDLGTTNPGNSISLRRPAQLRNAGETPLPLLVRPLHPACKTTSHLCAQITNPHLCLDLGILAFRSIVLTCCIQWSFRVIPKPLSCFSIL